MAGFWTHNAIALLVASSASLVSHFFIPEADWLFMSVLLLVVFIASHLPAIQQPASPSYQVVRNSSKIAAIVFPALIYTYRPTDLLLAWLATYILHSSTWWIIDQISLHRDYTRSIIAIIALPSLLTLGTYGLVGKTIVLPAFLSASSAYLTHLFIEQYRLETARKSISGIVTD
ncbi:MAG: hypothetical protein CR991_06050 [Proteobacteria bacterium]|nr:MAG: hypothetical protein CR991_06050 [Pseudomonadota bacterium]